MKEALKVIFLFKKPMWDDFRLPYIFFSAVGWSVIITLLIALIN